MKAEAILVTMPDGSTWQVPARLVAEDRARHYQDEGDFEGEVDFALGDEYTLLDWAAGNMNWSDVEAHAVRVRTRELTDDDKQEAWVNGPKEVVEQPLLELPAVTFTCKDCGERVEVAAVRCSACTAKARPSF